MNINERIKARRAELELTLEDIAKALNVSKSTVLRYETKEIENMGIDKLEALAKVLRVKPAYLMGWLDGPAPKDSAEAIIMVKKEAARAAIILNQLSPRDIDLATKVLERIASKAE